MSAQPAPVLPACTIGEAMYRVARWWRSTREGLHLGYASRSIIGRVMEEGCQGASQVGTARPATYMDDADEQIDMLVAKMPPELRDAVILDQKRNMPVKMIAATLRCTPAQFYRWKENGYGFIAGVLSAGGLTR